MGSQNRGVAVVGSANLDVVFSVDRLPRPGETIHSRSAATYPGGKGLNQAVAASRAGAETVFIGAVGDDGNGDLLAKTMADAGIDGSLLRRSGEPTGQAFILLDQQAENTIILTAGANGTVTSLTPAEHAAVATSAVLLMQLELPLSAVSDATSAARAAGTTVMLNAAPAQPLPPSLVERLDYLIVNEPEACILGESEDLDAACAALAERIPRVIVTLGARGSVLYDQGELLSRIPARTVQALDTTGAGDTFCGAFAAAIAGGRTMVAAAEFATTAASLAVQVLGAVPSVPLLAEIEAAIRGRE
jgi:ribokinase